MKRVIAIILVVALVATSGVLVALAKAGVFSRSKDADTEETTTTEYGEGLAPEGKMEDVSSDDTENTEEENLSDDDLLLRSAKQSLTVDVTQEVLDRYEYNYSQIFLDSSMPTRNKERTSAASKVGWGEENMQMYDAVEFPMPTVAKGKTKYSKDDVQKMHEANMERHARNVVVAMMTLEGMEEMKTTDNTAVADLNTDWVKPELDLYHEYGIGVFLTYHTKYWETYGFELPHDGQSVEEWKNEHPNAPEVTEDLMQLILEDVEETQVTSNDLENLYGLKGQQANNTPQYKLYVTSEGEHNFVDYVAKPLMMWFDRLTIEGVETYSTWHYWYLNSTMNGNDVRAIMNTDKTKVEALPALVYSMIVKYSNGETREIFFGYNIYDNRLEIFERTAEPVKTVQPKPTGQTTKDDTNPPGPTGQTNTNPPNPTGQTDTNPPGPSGHDNDDGTNPPKPNPPHPVNPTGNKDDEKGSVQQGQAQQGGGEGQGGTGAPTGDQSKNDMQDAGGGSDQNQGHSNPNTVTSDTPDTTTHDTSNSGSNGQNVSQDDGNSNTVENSNESQMNYGENAGASSNGGVDTSGSGASSGTDSDMGNDSSDNAIEEPGV